MTGAPEGTQATPILLLDDWMDGLIEERGWVQVTAEIADAEHACRYMEAAMPAADQIDPGGGEPAQYVPGGRAWLNQPDPTSVDGEGQVTWMPCEADAEGAVEFFEVRLEVDEGLAG